jgi:antitoxin ParD1/3/4
MYDIVIQEAHMAARANKPISVTLGPLAERAEARVRSGDYASISEVVRAGLRALDREDALLERLFVPIDEDDPEWIALVREKVAEALADPRPAISSEEAFARLDAHIAARKAKRAA